MSEDNHVEENLKPTPGGKKFFSWGCLIWVLVGLFCLGLLVALLLPARCTAREAARRIKCRNNIKNIGLALFNYHDEYGCFPPAYTVDAQGRRMHSWRVLILPFMEYGKEKVQYDFSQPWNSPDNIAFAEESSAYQIYRCPTEFSSDRNDSERPGTSYVMLVGLNAFADGTTVRKKEDITDGFSETIMVGEMSHSGILWTEPRDLNTSEMSYKINDPHQIGLRSEHSGGAHVLIADGSVRFFIDTHPENLIKALTTINGGEDMSEFHQY